MASRQFRTRSLETRAGDTLQQRNNRSKQHERPLNIDALTVNHNVSLFFRSQHLNNSLIETILALPQQTIAAHIYIIVYYISICISTLNCSEIGKLNNGEVYNNNFSVQCLFFNARFLNNKYPEFYPVLNGSLYDFMYAIICVCET